MLATFSGTVGGQLTQVLLYKEILYKYYGLIETEIVLNVVLCDCHLVRAVQIIFFVKSKIADVSMGRVFCPVWSVRYY
jgi:hypothetical protein